VSDDEATRHCDNLIAVHRGHGGPAPSQRDEEVSINRAVVVLAVASWRAVIQDFALHPSISARPAWKPTIPRDLRGACRESPEGSGRLRHSECGERQETPARCRFRPTATLDVVPARRAGAWNGDVVPGRRRSTNQRVAASAPRNRPWSRRAATSPSAASGSPATKPARRPDSSPRGRRAVPRLLPATRPTDRDGSRDPPRRRFSFLSTLRFAVPDSRRDRGRGLSLAVTTRRDITEVCTA